MADESVVPVTVYGSSISYFTGKLENYFRIKGVPYQLEPLTARSVDRMVKAETGSTQMPAVQIADGRWLTDTTPIIQWFESELPQPAVIPEDPVQRFFSLLLEDYADEWLWRPAMHYRWFYDVGARFASAHLAEEIAGAVPLPASAKRLLITRRQRSGYTRGDGITPDQVAGVEAIYSRTLEQLERILRSRPFLLGGRPSLADVGFSGPFFRHFGLDPVPAEIMRRDAPAVYEWIARLWNSRLAESGMTLLAGIPEDWGPVLDEIGAHYLPYLCANVDAVEAGQRRFDAEVGGVRYRRARWSPYRVWCLQKLRDAFAALDSDEQAHARALLERHGCWNPMWRHASLPLEAGFCEQLPFHADAKMIDVYQ
jgi:glutathione S-transferase